MFVIYGEKYLMEFRADAEVGHFASLALTEHGDIFLVGEVFNVGSRQSLGDRLMLELHWIEQRKPWVVLICLHYLEGIHLRSESNKLDDRIALALVLEISDFSSVELSITSSEFGNVPGTLLTKIKRVSDFRARVDFLCQIIDEKLEEK